MIRPTGPLAGRIVTVEALEERHREGLRAAAEDAPEIFRFMAWPGDFDRYFDEALASSDVPFAVCLGGEPAGSTRYMGHSPEHRRVEIGWTWLRRSAWRTGANVEAKLLLLACLRKLRFSGGVQDRREEPERAGRCSRWRAVRGDRLQAHEALRGQVTRLARSPTTTGWPKKWLEGRLTSARWREGAARAEPPTRPSSDPGPPWRAARGR